MPRKRPAQPRSRAGIGGPKPAVPGSPRRTHVATRVSEAERALLDRAAKALGVGVAELVRDGALEAARKALDSEGLQESS